MMFVNTETIEAHSISEFELIEIIVIEPMAKLCVIFP